MVQLICLQCIIVHLLLFTITRWKWWRCERNCKSTYCAIHLARFSNSKWLCIRLQMLFRATFAHEKCPDDFTLLCSYPRRQLNCAPEWYREYGSSVQDPANIPTFRACGFDNSVVVLVQDNDAWVLWCLQLQYVIHSSRLADFTAADISWIRLKCFLKYGFFFICNVFEC